ncbi:EthD domain-containing protein [Sphingobium sp. AP50]|uniref:EthD domain-containing protein n=1 Tax=Sphingobium sp. AP50 TaxID=1884369 RepID=UPI0008C19574|nr:EthD domain-containing protein [Sphingobium sp. AP50]SEJ90397.1 EthD domain-containing protein [Sphingobium sp. AP50]
MSNVAPPTIEASDRPSTVIFSFLSRADSVPLSERRRGEGHILDEGGRPVDDPTAQPEANIFGRDPNTSFEQWAEYWRKVHGVRFTHAEDPEDNSLDHLLRYDQIHRMAAGPSSQFPQPYSPPLDENGQLFPTVVGHIPRHVRPRWDGVAYLTFDTVDSIAQVFGSPRVQKKILPEDMAMFRDIAPILARQHVRIPAQGVGAISLVRLHVRDKALDRAEFQKRWLTDHADVVLEHEETAWLVHRYVQLENAGGTSEGEPFYHPETSLIDGVTLMSFASMNDVEAYLQSPAWQVILQHEATFSDVTAAEYWTAVNFGIVNRVVGERVTLR